MKFLTVFLWLGIATSANAFWFETSNEKVQRASQAQKINFEIHKMNESMRNLNPSVGHYPESSNGRCVINSVGTQWPGLNGYAPGEAEKCQLN